MKRIDTTFVNISYSKPVVHLVFKKDIELGFPEIEELTRLCEEISEHTPYFVLSDVRENMNVTPEGRKLAADEKAAPLHRGTAVIVKSTMLQLAINFFNGYRKPLYPFRAFTNEDAARSWLIEIERGLSPLS